MAKVGLKYPVYAFAEDNGSSISYSGGAVLAKAISANVSIETNDVKLYADDGIVERDKSFAGGEIEMGIDDLPDKAKVDLLDYTEGAVVDIETGAKELSTAGAEPPFVGFGFYGKCKKWTNYWRAIWLIKTQFAEPNEEFKTQGESVEFSTPTIKAAIMSASWDTTYWKEQGTFSTEAKAKAWLDGKAGIVAKAANVVSSVSSGTYADAQSVVLTTTEAAGTIYYTTDGTIPSATNGTEYSTAIACADPSNTCIKAVCVAAGKANSDILELYITVTA